MAQEGCAVAQDPLVAAQGSWRHGAGARKNPINLDLIQKKGYRILRRKNYFSEAIQRCSRDISSVETHSNLICNEFYYFNLCLCY